MERTANHEHPPLNPNHLHTMTLTKGSVYNVETLRAVGWTAGDGTGHEGYNVSDYFSVDGTYLGADECGIEPLFDESSVA